MTETSSMGPDGLPRRVAHLDDSALEHAHRDFAGIAEDQTVREALESVRRGKLSSRIVYFYVLDQEQRLVGVVPTRRLLLAEPGQKISDLMIRKVISLPEQATLLDACELFIMHRLMALPIVDPEGKPLGVIDIDQYTEEIRELDAQHESDEIFQLIGVRMAEVQQQSLFSRFRVRFPWLLCNIGGGLACALIAGMFQGLLQQVVALALFIPVVLALAESVSIQSLTLALQTPLRHPPGWRQMASRMGQEFLTGIALGVACGLVVGLVAGVWQADTRVGVCIGGSIVLAVLGGALYGHLVPALLFRMQRDPKVASGPMVLALTDMTATVLYLGLSTMAFRQ